MGRTLQVAATAVVLSACAGTAEPTSVGAVPTPVDPAQTTAASPVDEADAEAVLVATVEEQLAGTVYAGLALADPSGFVATGEVMCDLLDGGATVDEVLSVYLTELEQARQGLADDDAVLSGAVLGAAVGSLCPQHDDALAGG